MYILYRKEENKAFQTWRGKQIAMCAEKEPLQKWVDTRRDPKQYYIEKQPERAANDAIRP